MSFMQPILHNNSLKFPGGPVPLESPFYIERPPIEQLAYAEVEQPGSLIRIKASRAMGKSSLLNRVLAHAEGRGCQIVHLDFQEADELTLNALNPLLRWFCVNASCKLQMPPRLSQYWDEAVGSRVSCSLYWQGYLLNQSDRPIVLALSHLDWLFEYPRVAREFLSLLRSWHEKAKQSDGWRKLRLIVDYSTDAYVPLDVTQSPFNVGLSLRLPPFNLEQIHALAQRYELNWVNSEAEQSHLVALQQLTGGLPYLVNLALYQLRRGGSLEDFCSIPASKVSTETICGDC
ncbi:MAG: hypothetical protein HC827_13450 [Cyanobacteria bacterium RM1_2_2]|nr:hypothetical protein [Cyanobacteria bacterium RM1_2_2]